MKINTNISVLIICLLAIGQLSRAQSKDYRKDSLQFKMYTRLYVNDQLGVDSIAVKKIFCDYCSKTQMEVLENEAIRQSKLERYNPKYKKPGEHRLALIVRFSKEDFRKLNTRNE
jgi:hypothetical protein